MGVPRDFNAKNVYKTSFFDDVTVTSFDNWSQKTSREIVYFGLIYVLKEKFLNFL